MMARGLDGIPEANLRLFAEHLHTLGIAVHAADKQVPVRMPRRVKVTGDLFHGRVPEGAKYIGRAAPGLRKSPYANPYAVNRYGLELSLRGFRQYLADSPELVEQARRDLRGMDLACWCDLPADGEPDLCHGALLLAAIYPELAS